MPPKASAKSADRAGGVLAVSATTRANAARASTARLKLEIRRLPPGLTLTEFEDTLGAEWKLGNGKIDWREYRQGKTRLAGSGKVPEQGRCYLHVVNESLVKELETRFLEVLFQDKAGTYKNPELKQLQPVLGFAPNQRTPLQHPKQRVDTRQGTIDQDPDFMAFLEGETQPVTKASAIDTMGAEKSGEKITVKTTPLIEDLREKKANKAKAAVAKAEKAEKDKKMQTVAAGPKPAGAAAQKDGAKGNQPTKVEQAAKEAAKVLNKQAATKQQQAQQTKPASPAKAKAPVRNSKQDTPAVQPATASAVAGPAPQRTAARQRGNAEGIKKMLQKDLGIKPKVIPAAQSPATSTPSAAPATASTNSASPAPTPTPSTTRPSPASVPPTQTDPKPSLVKAYLKHANPSQGMTEMLIQQALSQFGEMSNVTIDPRKGTAIAVFKQLDGLRNALAAKHVPVANGAVEVLEFRDRAGSGPPVRGGFRAGRGGRGGARGAGHSSVVAPPPSTVAAPAASATSTSLTAAGP